MPNLKSAICDPLLYTDVLGAFLPAFFPHICESILPDGSKVVFKSPKFHHEIIDCLKQQNAKTVIISSRGSSKSTLITFLWVLYCSCFGMSAFTIIVSDSFKKACNFLDRIKREITDNKFLAETFEIEPGVPWSQGELVFKIGWLGGKRIRLLARGAGQSLRGYVDNVRPQMIVLDDIEEENNTATPDKRAKIRDWLFGQVLPSLDPMTGRLVFVGTIVHEDAMLARLYKDPPKGWVVKKYSILDEKGKSIWPERFSEERIMEIKEEYARSGTLMRFMMEYMNNPSAAEFRVFDKEHIRYYNPFNLRGELRHYMAVDFGFSVAGDSDFTVVMVCGIDDSSNIYVREYVRRRMKPNETLSVIVDLYNKYNCNAVGIETNGPQKIYYYMLDEHVKSSSFHNVRIVELNHTIKKEDRIMNLQPKFQEGKIFILPDMHDLENELLKFTPLRRSADHDDTIDTLSNLVLTMNRVNATAPRKKFNPIEYQGSDNVPTHTFYLP